MFIIDFRNKKVSQYGFSVVNNNDVDIVHIYSHFVQYRDYLVYLKVESEDKSYVDEILIDSENISVEEGALLVKWTMGAISTQCKKIYIQLEFREGNEENSKVAQTNIVSITLGDTIDTSEGAKHLYPQILKELQRQIDELKVGSVSDFDLDYTNDVLTITLFNEEGEAVSQLQATIPTSTKVDKIAGKGLSTNDFTDALLNKLNSIAEGAQVNVLEGVKVNGTELPIDEHKKVNIDISGKVDKTTEHNKVYGTDNSGTQTVMPVDNGSDYGGNVARRDNNNQVHLPLTPTANSHATSKGYVDQLVANIKKDSYKEVDTTEYPTLADFLASTGEEGYLYLYPIDTTDLTRGYYRYIWEGNAWLDLGTTQIDLSNYYTKNETNTLLGAKANQSDLTAHTGDTNNPHNVTKAQVGLGNADNTSDMDKPVSTAQQQALNEKQNDVCLSVVDGKLCITYEA